jgi:UDP-3-O-[3-hydroxymyristoyl] glucosamine N-acyltransferase
VVRVRVPSAGVSVVVSVSARWLAAVVGSGAVVESGVVVEPRAVVESGAVRSSFQTLGS